MLRTLWVREASLAFSPGITGILRSFTLSPKPGVWCGKAPRPPWPGLGPHRFGHLWSPSPGLALGSPTVPESLCGEPEPTWGSDTAEKTSQHSGKEPVRAMRGWGLLRIRKWGGGGVHKVPPSQR